jgi:hypothetical protein
MLSHCLLELVSVSSVFLFVSLLFIIAIKVLARNAKRERRQNDEHTDHHQPHKQMVETCHIRVIVGCC